MQYVRFLNIKHRTELWNSCLKLRIKIKRLWQSLLHICCYTCCAYRDESSASDVNQWLLLHRVLAINSKHCFSCTHMVVEIATTWIMGNLLNGKVLLEERITAIQYNFIQTDHFYPLKHFHPNNMASPIMTPPLYTGHKGSWCKSYAMCEEHILEIRGNFFVLSHHHNATGINVFIQQGVSCRIFNCQCAKN